MTLEDNGSNEGLNVSANSLKRYLVKNLSLEEIDRGDTLEDFDLVSTNGFSSNVLSDCVERYFQERGYHPTIRSDGSGFFKKDNDYLSLVYTPMGSKRISFRLQRH